MKQILYLSTVVFLFILTGCNDGEPLPRSDIASDLQSGEYVFTLDEAVEYAASAGLPGEEIATRAGSRTVAQAGSIGEGTPDMHIVNYAGGGYAIISADTRLEPLLAYSYEGSFDFDGEIPYGFQLWMNNVSLDIASKRAQNAVQSPALAARWGAFAAAGNALMVMPPPTSCSPNGAYYPNYHTELYGPLLTTASWHQGVGFNDALPYRGCSSYSNFRPPVGCVPLACAKVMKHYQKPTNLSWASMGSGSSALQTLLKNLGTQLGTTYSCSESVTLGSVVAGVLINNYGYSSCPVSGYNYSSVYSFIINNKPVLMGGFGPTGGHMWVCDGLELVYDGTCNGNTITTTLWNKYLHMDWGWGIGSMPPTYCSETYFGAHGYSFNNSVSIYLLSK
ncbi:MAG: C10 family peptidase [Tannerellaceae bacterium]|jgi:hypothetical protein|nr:C10 family peptidase [Tannerellaceae bacterium]